MSVSELTGRRKAATVLLALGPERSAQVLRHLSQSEVEDLVLEVLKIGTLGEDQTNQVFEEFYQIAVAQDYLAVGGTDYARELLVNALGEERAREILARLSDRVRPRPFSFLRHTEPAQLTTFLQEEKPQTIALVLGHVPPALAATVLKTLPVELSSEVALRLAAMDRTAPEVVEAVEAALQHRMGGVLTTDYTRVGGAEFMAKVLGQADRGTEKAVLGALDERDSELASEVRHLLFTFEAINILDDRSLQRVLREVDLKDIPLALKNAPAELQEQIFRNLSQRSTEVLREEMELLGPVRARQVQEAQQRIVAIIRRLEEQEEILIERGDENDFV
ncbi:MAG: flagellar motor switch protein FliG [Chloroflexota bacterium]